MRGIVNKFAFVFIFFCQVAFSQFRETVPTDYWVYPIIEELKVRGYFRGLPQGFKPYTRIEIAEEILKEKGKTIGEFERGLFSMLEDEFREEINFLTRRDDLNLDDGLIKPGVMLSGYAWREPISKRIFRFRGRGKFAFYYSDKFTLYNNSLVDQNLLDDTTYTGKRFWNIAGYTEQGYLRFDLGGFSLKLGRDYVKWGYGRSGNLLISDYAIPYDMINVDIFTRYFKYSWFISQLDNMKYSLDGGKTYLDANRYLTGGRLEVNIREKLFLGFAQMILYGGYKRQIDIGLSNPLAFYYEIQANEGKELNGMVYFDLLFYPFKNFSLYYEFLIDDWQVSRKTKGDLEPNEYGFIIGISMADLLKNIGLAGNQIQIEYVQIRNRTYNTLRDYEKYLRFRRPIAHPLGNDFHSIDIWISQWLLKRMRLTLSYKFVEHGEGSIEKPFDTPWMAPEVTVETGYHEKFPFGVVERRNQFGFNIFYFISSGLNLNFDFYFTNYRNYKNIEGRRKNEFNFRFWIFFNYDKLFK